MITFAVVYDAILVTFRFAEERRLEKKMIKTQPYFNETSPGNDFSQVRIELKSILNEKEKRIRSMGVREMPSK
jgi:hypothetical protein